MATYKIDPAHSEITFKVKHLMITNVTGKFNKFDATLESTKEDLTDAVISFSAETGSIDTGNTQRDEHLQSDDFFAAAKYPALTFKSTAFNKTGSDTYQLTGDLTIRDVTKSVTLDVEYGGTVVDPWNQTKLGFEITGKINRQEFGLTFSAVTEAGGVVVADDIKLNLGVQMIKQ